MLQQVFGPNDFTVKNFYYIQQVRKGIKTIIYQTRLLRNKFGGCHAEFINKSNFSKLSGETILLIVSSLQLNVWACLPCPF